MQAACARCEQTSERSPGSNIIKSALELSAGRPGRLGFYIIAILIYPLRPSQDLRLRYVVSAANATPQRYVLRVDPALALENSRAAGWFRTRLNGCRFKCRGARRLL